MNLRVQVVALLGIAFLTNAGSAQTAYPMVTHTFPLAVERGTTSEVTVRGQRNFAGAFAAYFQGEGITAEVLPQLDKQGKPLTTTTDATLRLTVSDDAVLGPREFRLATAQGVSTVGQIIVTDQPVLQEVAKHDTLATAQPIEINRMVAGIIAGREEVDFYKFSAKAGQQITFEIHSARLMFKVHDLQKHFDPILSVFDSNGRELASNDDYYFADPMLSHQFTADGEYYVSVRDVRYDSDPRWSYCLLVTDGPYVTAVQPMAVSAGASAKLQAVGFNLLQSEFEHSFTDKTGTHWIQLGSERPSNAVAVEVTSLPLSAEAEPNNEIQKATPAMLPTVINGSIQAESDVDHFAFDLKKGDKVRFEVRARRNGSSLDSSLRLLNEKSAAVAATDDHATTKDSVLVATIAADGRYYLEVKDLLNRGGPTFNYIVQAQYDEPDFEIVCDDDKAGIAPGGHVPWFVKITRNGGFDGPVDVRVDGLPEGVSVNPLTIPAGMTQGCLILTAAPDAMPALAPVQVVGKAEAVGKDQSKKVIERVATPVSEIYVPGGGRGLWNVETHVVQVNPISDLKEVRVTPEKISLKPGEKVELQVEVVRNPNYTGRVTLDFLLRHLGRVYADPLPPGIKLVESASKTSLNPDETKGKLVLEAAADAKPVENIPIAVMAHVSINFVVKRPYASAPIWLTITEK